MAECSTGKNDNFPNYSKDEKITPSIKLTLIVSCYNVAPYLPDFLASLARQGSSLLATQAIFVIDGSPDDSEAIVREWLQIDSNDGEVIVQSNGGLSSARNAGLGRATGEWVSFPDPDDMLSDGYLDEVLRFVESSRCAQASLITTNIIYYDDATAALSNTHPLRFKFSGATKLVDLEQSPHYVHLSSATAFYRLSEIGKCGLIYDSRVKPNFEDGVFTAHYLMQFDRPRTAILPNATYHYRRRSDDSSLVAGSWGQDAKYLDVPRFGYLSILQAAEKKYETIPEWVQSLVLYDLQWFFRSDERVMSPTAGISKLVKTEFLSLLSEVLLFIDTEAILAYRASTLSITIRYVLISLKGGTIPLSELHVTGLDREKQLLQIRYFFTGVKPDEKFRISGKLTKPTFKKTRTVEYFGEPIMFERIVWLPADRWLAVWIDGKRIGLKLGPLRVTKYVYTEKEIWKYFDGGDEQSDSNMGRFDPAPSLSFPRRLRKALGRRRRALRKWAEGLRPRTNQRMDKILLAIGRSKIMRGRYKDAWVLIDRDTQAQDNAEHFYRYLRDNRPSVNAWFVLNRKSDDWQRLSRDRFRLVGHGSRTHVILMKNAAHLISSQADHYIVNPIDVSRFGRGGWKYTFLQHGVTMNDLSRWLNGKPISLMITSGEAERQSIVAEYTPYVFTEKEITLTGMPRHDRLLEISDKTSEASQNLILVMPTWRHHLLGPTVGASNHRPLKDGFWSSKFATSWMEFLSSQRLQEAADSAGLTIAFVPHSNFQAHISATELPQNVQLIRFSEVDIQETIARAAIVVTDYSSLSFEGAFIHRPVVYFQFDQEEFFSGAHPHRPGYFDYETDGFGPVQVGLEDAVASTISIIENRQQYESEYFEKAERAFAFRDGKNSERVYERIQALRRPSCSN